MILSKQITEAIKELIVKGYRKEDAIPEIAKKYGNYKNLDIWFDICYNSVSKEMGIDRNHGQEIKHMKKRLRTKNH
jgi:hypothetical protein